MRCRTLVAALAAAMHTTRVFSPHLLTHHTIRAPYLLIRVPIEKELSDLRQSLGLLHGAKSAAEVGRGRAPEG